MLVAPVDHMSLHVRATVFRAGGFHGLIMPLLHVQRPNVGLLTRVTGGEQRGCRSGSSRCKVGYRDWGRMCHSVLVAATSTCRMASNRVQ
jgi:hypothetical protein